MTVDYTNYFDDAMRGIALRLDTQAAAFTANNPEPQSTDTTSGLHDALQHMAAYDTANTVTQAIEHITHHMGPAAPDMTNQLPQPLAIGNATLYALPGGIILMPARPCVVEVLGNPRTDHAHLRIWRNGNAITHDQFTTTDDIIDYFQEVDPPTDEHDDEP